MDRMSEPHSMLFGALVGQPGALSGDRSGPPAGRRSYVGALFVCMAVASLVVAALA
ncbi:MAG TPA: hypothetical protein VMK32_09955 [Burkholderiaceae bacterium]|nr:hypothetical protein [Burkholderiaceae bacterium]